MSTAWAICAGTFDAREGCLCHLIILPNMDHSKVLPSTVNPFSDHVQ